MLSSRTFFKGSLGALAILGMLGLSACGYRPLYGKSSANPQILQHLNAVEIEPLPNRIGQQMRAALSHKLSRRANTQEKAYSLSVNLTESISQLAVEKDAFATRANLRLTASYKLVRLADYELLDEGSLSTIASYNILSSDYATLSARQSARDNAVNNLAGELYTRLSTYFQGPGTHQPPVKTGTYLR